MRIAYFDCFGGISGDMCLGALVDAGLDPHGLEEELKRAGITGFSLTTQLVQRQGIGATQVSVNLTENAPPFRGLPEIRVILNQSLLSQEVKQKALRVFERLAEAEAQVHKLPVDKVHFHEIGATDALVDILGTLLGLERLGIKQIYASALPVGRGPVVCQHGILPNPAPATLELCRGIPLYDVAVEGELVTPTGAALITTLATQFNTWPPMQVKLIGYGAGSRPMPRANVLRLWIGEMLENTAPLPPDLIAKIIVPQSFSSENQESTQNEGHQKPPALQLEEVYLLESTIDDMNPEWFTRLRSQLEKAGAIDTYYRQVLMKKGRPGIELCVLSHATALPDLVRTILGETTTLGVRIRAEKRICLPRQIETIETPAGPMEVKVTWAPRPKGGWYCRVKPEFESFHKAAENLDLTAPEVEALAASCYQKKPVV
ncbi:MAG: nickel pincer cofactor biosynthesis protein LarC [Syntrophomonadaceae bacterium]|nr:nickel pincer cofactor biosynthesis protein LarC [Syntrophomonadaceae bacterium]